jgi:hypothetical protein
MNRSWAFPLVTTLLAALALSGWHAALAAPPAQGDLAVITSPTNNAVVRGQVPIVGSATHPQFQFYKVEFSREPPGGDETWAIVGAIVQQGVVNGQLAVWDTTRVPDGSYTVRLRVVRLDGNYSEYVVRQIVVANAQPEQPTETPTIAAELLTPTVTPTPLPPTPTIVIEQPARPTEQAIPGLTRTPLPTPVQEGGSFSIDPAPFQNACLYGLAAILGIFLLFGFLAVLRNLVYSLLGRRDR